MEHILPNRGRKLVGKQQQETSINETMMRKEKWKKEIECIIHKVSIKSKGIHYQKSILKLKSKETFRNDTSLGKE